jgi:hypothetical protein
MGEKIKSNATVRNPSPEIFIRARMTVCTPGSILSHDFPAACSWKGRNLVEKILLYAIIDETIPITRYRKRGIVLYTMYMSVLLNTFLPLFPTPDVHRVIIKIPENIAI